MKEKERFFDEVLMEGGNSCSFFFRYLFLFPLRELHYHSILSKDVLFNSKVEASRNEYIYIKHCT